LFLWKLFWVIAFSVAVAVGMLYALHEAVAKIERRTPNNLYYQNWDK
jgi:hypothetical protein